MTAMCALSVRCHKTQKQSMTQQRAGSLNHGKNQVPGVVSSLMQDKRQKNPYEEI